MDGHELIGANTNHDLSREEIEQLVLKLCGLSGGEIPEGYKFTGIAAVVFAESTTGAEDEMIMPLIMLHPEDSPMQRLLDASGVLKEVSNMFWAQN